MVAIVKGVHIDSDQFPDTYKARKRIITIAARFKQPAEDLLQEAMMKELELKRNPTKQHLKNLRENPQYYQNYLAMQAFTRQINYQKQYTYRHTSLEDVKDQVEGTFVVFSRKEIYTKMFVDEMFQVLDRRDKTLSRILKHKVEAPDKSWRSIYAHYYRRSKSRGWFFERVGAIKRAAKAMAKDSASVLADTAMTISRSGRRAIEPEFAL